MPLQRMNPRTTIAIPMMTRNFPTSGTIQSWSAIRSCRAQSPLPGRHYEVRAAHAYSVIPSASEGPRRWSLLTHARLCIDTAVVGSLIAFGMTRLWKRKSSLCADWEADFPVAQVKRSIRAGRTIYPTRVANADAAMTFKRNGSAISGLLRNSRRVEDRERRRDPICLS
jgi:hypothetical protein